MKELKGFVAVITGIATLLIGVTMVEGTPTEDTVIETVAVTGEVVSAADADGDGKLDTWELELNDGDADPDITVFNYTEPDGSELVTEGKPVKATITKTAEGYKVLSWDRIGQ